MFADLFNGLGADPAQSGEELLAALMGLTQQFPLIENVLFSAQAPGFTVEYIGIAVGDDAMTVINITTETGEVTNIVAPCNPFAAFRLCLFLTKLDLEQIKPVLDDTDFFQAMAQRIEGFDPTGPIKDEFDQICQEVTLTDIPAEVVEFSLPYPTACCRHHFTEELERGTLTWAPRFATMGVLTLDEAQQLAGAREELLSQLRPELVEFDGYLWQCLTGELTDDEGRATQLRQLHIDQLVVDAGQRFLDADVEELLGVVVARMWHFAQSDTDSRPAGINMSIVLSASIACDWLIAEELLDPDEAPGFRLWLTRALNCYDEMPVVRTLTYGKW